MIINSNMEVVLSESLENSLNYNIILSLTLQSLPSSLQKLSYKLSQKLSTSVNIKTSNKQLSLLQTIKANQTSLIAHLQDLEVLIHLKTNRAIQSLSFIKSLQIHQCLTFLTPPQIINQIFKAAFMIKLQTLSDVEVTWDYCRREFRMIKDFEKWAQGVMPEKMLEKEHYGDIFMVYQEIKKMDECRIEMISNGLSRLGEWVRGMIEAAEMIKEVREGKERLKQIKREIESLKDFNKEKNEEQKINQNGAIILEAVKDVLEGEVDFEESKEIIQKVKEVLSDNGIKF